MSDLVTSSDESELEIDDGPSKSKLEVDDSICPTCKGSTFVGETISCDKCEFWFHWTCEGVKPGDDVVIKEDIPFYCGKCRPKSNKKSKQQNAQTSTTKNPTPKSSSSSAKSTPKISSRKGQGGKIVIGSFRPKSKRQSTSVYKKHDDDEDEDVAPPDTPKSPPIKLKISLGGKSSTVVSASPPAAASTPQHGEHKRSIKFSASTPAQSEIKSNKNSERTEEEAWLDAVESGDMSKHVDPELRSIKNPKMMTARQRAMVERLKQSDGDSYLADESNLSSSTQADDSLPVMSQHISLDYKKKKRKIKENDPDEEINLKIKAMKAEKRKEIELEKREEEKQKTVDRLLKKSDSKSIIRLDEKNQDLKRSIPKITYRIAENEFSLSFPRGASYPIKPRKLDEEKDVPKPVECSIPGCSKVKRYNCSKSGKPLCSLACYKQNQALIQAA